MKKTKWSQTKKIKKFKKKLVVKKVKRAVRKKSKNTNKQKVKKAVGKITHFYAKIKVAVIKVASPLKIGDTIEIIGGEATDFIQKIVSMQKDHKSIKSAKKGASVGVKIKKPVKQGYKIYKA